MREFAPTARDRTGINFCTSSSFATPRFRSGHFKERSSSEESGKRAALGSLVFSLYATRRPPVRRFLIPSVPLRLSSGIGIRADAGQGLCARPAHAGRSARGGTLGRNLPGRMDSWSTRRRRRSFPAFERLRSVPGRKDGYIMREVFIALTKRGNANAALYLPPCEGESDFNILAGSEAEAKC